MAKYKVLIKKHFVREIVVEVEDNGDLYFIKASKAAQEAPDNQWKVVDVHSSSYEVLNKK